MDELVKAIQVYAVDNAIVQTGDTATTITIKLTATGVQGESATFTENSTEVKAFNEYVPNWKKIVKKSKQWGTKSDDPTVELSIDKDGGVTVTSTIPADFETYGKTSTE